MHARQQNDQINTENVALFPENNVLLYWAVEGTDCAVMVSVPASQVMRQVLVQCHCMIA